MTLQKRLEGLSAQAATLFSDASVVGSDLRPLWAKIKDLFVEIDCVAVEQLSVKDSEERNHLSRLIEQERIRKVEFDGRVAAWFEQRGCKDGDESSSWREEPTTRSKRSKVSTCRSKSRSRSHSTSHSKTSSLVKRVLAQLQLRTAGIRARGRATAVTYPARRWGALEKAQAGGGGMQTRRKETKTGVSGHTQAARTAETDTRDPAG